MISKMENAEVLTRSQLKNILGGAVTTTIGKRKCAGNGGCRGYTPACCTSTNNCCYDSLGRCCSN